MADYKEKKSKAAMDLGVKGPHHSKIKGMKIHHDPDYSKNKDADVIPKGNKRAIPNEQWEVRVPCSAHGDGDKPDGAFLPTPGKDRAQPHLKINECDH